MPSNSPSPSRPLAGIRVIELSAYVASPLAGLVLAQLGADVVRVEPVGGQVDRARLPLSRDGTSLYWSGLNQGKRAIEVNLRSREGREIVAKLITRSGANAGIVVSNTSAFPDLSYASLSQARPDLIYVLLQGHRDGSSAVDYTVQAEVGLHALTGPQHECGPVNDTLPFWDVASGLYLATGVLAAERYRQVSGHGQQVTVALHDVALATLGNLGILTEAQVNSTPRGRIGNYVYGTYGRDFRTRDGGRIMLVVLTAKHWRQLLEATGLTSALTGIGACLDVDFSLEAERYRYRELLSSLLDPWFAARDLADVVSILESTTVVFSEYRTLSDLAADERRLLAREPLLAELDQPGVGTHYAPRTPVVMGGESSPVLAAPGVGQHTDEVLAELLGYSTTHLSRLHASGILGN